MSARLCFLSCHNFHAEVGASVTAEGWDDVVAVAFPAHCGRPPVSWDELRPLLPEDCGQVVVLGRSCLTNLGDPPADWPPTRIVPMTQCFYLVAGETLVEAEISGGGYLLTPAWLADWRGQLQAMGFAPEQAGEFFHDFARELVLLDTGIDPLTTRRLAELQEGKAISLAWDKSREFTRQQRPPGFTDEAMTAIFRADPAKLPAYAGAVNEKGGFSLYRVTKVTNPEIKDDALKSASAQLSGAISRELFTSYIAALKKKSDVVIHQENFDKKDKG